MLQQTERGIVAKNSYIDTQGMTLPGKVPTDSKPVEYPPPVFKKLKVFTDLERKEIKEIIHEALDEREYKHEDDSWLYRGTY